MGTASALPGAGTLIPAQGSQQTGSFKLIKPFNGAQWSITRDGAQGTHGGGGHADKPVSQDADPLGVQNQESHRSAQKEAFAAPQRFSRERGGEGDGGVGPSVQMSPTTSASPSARAPHQQLKGEQEPCAAAATPGPPIQAPGSGMLLPMVLCP